MNDVMMEVPATAAWVLADLVEAEIKRCTARLDALSPRQAQRRYEYQTRLRDLALALPALERGQRIMADAFVARMDKSL